MLQLNKTLSFLKVNKIALSIVIISLNDTIIKCSNKKYTFIFIEVSLPTVLYYFAKFQGKLLLFLDDYIYNSLNNKESSNNPYFEFKMSIYKKYQIRTNLTNIIILPLYKGYIPPTHSFVKVFRYHDL